MKVHAVYKSTLGIHCLMIFPVAELTFDSLAFFTISLYTQVHFWRFRYKKYSCSRILFPRSQLEVSNDGIKF